MSDLDKEIDEAIFKLRTTHEVEHNDNKWTTEFVYPVEDVREAIGNLIAQAEKEANGCPCLLVESCSYACSCANPNMSGGCERCCRYGSLEQRKASADLIAQAEQDSYDKGWEDGASHVAQ